MFSHHGPMSPGAQLIIYTFCAIYIPACLAIAGWCFYKAFERLLKNWRTHA